MIPRSALCLSLIGIFLFPFANSIKAQGVNAVAATQLRCTGQVISNIVVLTQPPYTDKLPERLEFARHMMVRFHSNTRDEIIRRFLLFKEGDNCSEIERQESERILRVQPFLVDAEIRAYDDGEGGVYLEVETRDEFSLVAGLRIGSSPVLRGITLGESNLGGQGMYGSLSWRDGGAYNDLLGFRLVNHQFLGQRNIARLYGTRAERGHTYGAEVLKPYYTDLQNFAWHVGYGGTRDYVPFVRRMDDGAALALRREFGNMAFAFRVGEPGRLRIVGASITRERDNVDSRPVQIHRDGFRDDTLAALFPQLYRSAHVTRLNALLGVRRLSFMRVEGFDALTGVQDMRVGVQSAFTLGRSFQVLGGRDKDYFVRNDVYLGGGSPRSFFGVEALTEARRDNETKEWDGIISSGRMAWYYKPWRNQVTVASMEWSGGWRVSVPYQLTFRDKYGGLHGHGDSRDAGSHRAVLRVEQRWLPNPRTTVGDIGIAIFADAGRLWNGDVPFASDTRVRGAVGVGILAAVPRRSRRVFRMDLGIPVGGDPHAGIELRFSARDGTRSFRREPRDVEYARERAVPASIFTWP